MKLNPIKTLALSTIIVFFFYASLLYASPKPFKIKSKTYGEQQESMQQFLKEHFISIVKDANEIKIKTDGKINVYIWRANVFINRNHEWETEFTLKQSDQFGLQPYYKPEQGGQQSIYANSMSFKLVEIKNDKIIIQYKSQTSPGFCSTFDDHDCWVTIDTGVVELKYKNF